MRRNARLVMAAMVVSMLSVTEGRAAAQGHAPSVEAPPVAAAQRDRAQTPRPGRITRLVRELQRPDAGPAGGALRVDLDLFVVGQAPPPVLFEDGQIAIGAPVYGGATHDEMLTVVTPPQLRSTAPYRRLRPSLSLDR